MIGLGPELPSQSTHNRPPRIAPPNYRNYPSQVQRATERLYARISAGQTGQQNVLQFAHELVPAAGFSGGCILTFEIESTMLYPRFRFGRCSIGEKPVDCSPIAPGNHPAVQAFRSTGPVMQRDIWNLQAAAFLVQAFGDIQRVGVLHLDLGPGILRAPDRELFDLFSLLRKVFLHCLNVQ